MLTIPGTDFVVHPLCLGGNVFGWSADEPQSHQVLNAYASHGGNFINTADVYCEWKEGNKGVNPRPSSAPGSSHKIA